MVDAAKFNKLVNYIQTLENGSYHPIKQQYTVMIDFIEAGKIYKKGIVVRLSKDKKVFTKIHPDQSVYEQDVFYLKTYIEYRASLCEEFRRSLKIITFSNDYKSIRVGI